MPRFSGAILLALGVAAGAAGGYWYARLPARAPASAVALESIATAAERKILYYRDTTAIRAARRTFQPNRENCGRAIPKVYP